MHTLPPDSQSGTTGRHQPIQDAHGSSRLVLECGRLPTDLIRIKVREFRNEFICVARVNIHIFGRKLPTIEESLGKTLPYLWIELAIFSGSRREAQFGLETCPHCFDAVVEHLRFFAAWLGV